MHQVCGQCKGVVKFHISSNELMRQTRLEQWLVLQTLKNSRCEVRIKQQRYTAPPDAQACPRAGGGEGTPRGRAAGGRPAAAIARELGPRGGAWVAIQRQVASTREEPAIMKADASKVCCQLFLTSQKWVGFPFKYGPVLKIAGSSVSGP